MMWVLVFMAFSFPYGPKSDVVSMRTWKHPAVFNSLENCEQMGVELRQLSPKDHFNYACAEIRRYHD